MKNCYGTRKNCAATSKLRKPASLRYFFEFNISRLLIIFSKLEEKLATLQGEHAHSKQEYENQQSERTRIRYFFLLQTFIIRHFIVILQPS
jgi:hypothetical protein